MHSLAILGRRGGEWNVLLLGVVCALLAAAPAEAISADATNARYAMALAVLEQCGSTTAPGAAQHDAPGLWEKHLPYLMTALHQMATPGGAHIAPALTIKDSLRLSRYAVPVQSYPSELPRIAVQHSGISTTHFLH